jgi:hypothetical protein
MTRRGPKRKAGKREPNGKLSRKIEDKAERQNDGLDREQRDVLSVGLSARERIWGVKPQHSRDQKAGSAIGRYCLQGQITQAQYDAAMQFLESYHRHLRAIDAPQPHPGAIDLNAVRGRPVLVENLALLAKWEQDYAGAILAIREKQNEIRLQGNLYGSLYTMLVKDVMLDTLLGDVRTACNALAKHYKLLERQAA